MSQDKYIVVVKPDQTAFIYTGYTATTTLIASGGCVVNNVSGTTWIVYAPTGGTDTTILIGSGDTSVTNISGDTWIIYSNTGSTSGITTLIGSGGTWAGFLSGNTWIVYSPDYTQEMIDLFNLENSFTGHTGTTDIHTPYSAITFAISAATSGLTSSWSGLTGQPMDNADLAAIITGITADTQTNYECCTGNTADILWLSGYTSGHTHDYVTNATFSGYTGATNLTLTGITADIQSVSGCCTGNTALINDLTVAFTGHTGDTSIHTEYSAITFLISASTSGITSSWSGITNKPAWITGDTAVVFASGHTHSLDSLSDVVITLPTVTSFLRYTTGGGGQWIDAEVEWGNIGGIIGLQSDLMLLINNKTNTGTTQALTESFTGYTATTNNTLTGHTADILANTICCTGNTADIQWLSGYTSGHTHAFSGLSDTVLTGITNLDYVRFSSGATKWINEQPTDIFANVIDGYLLRRNGTAVTGISASYYLTTAVANPLYVNVTGDTMTGLLTLNAGLTETGAVANLNASSNFAVNIANGTSTGAVGIGNGASTQTIALGGATTKTITLGGTTSINTSINSATNINAGTSTGTVTIGGEGIMAIAIGASTGVKTITIGSHATPANVISIGGAASTTTLGGTVNVTNATDIFANVTDLQLLRRNGTAITGYTLSSLATAASVQTYTGTTAPAQFVGQINFKTAFKNIGGVYSASTATDYVLNYTGSTSGVTVLPTAASISGRQFVVKLSGTGTVTVDGLSAETIDGLATYTLSTRYQSITLVSDGTNWLII